MRILIIANNAINERSNNGKTLRSFLKGIPKEDIAQLYICSNEFPDELVCGHFYRITEFQIMHSLLNFSFKTRNTHVDRMAEIAADNYDVSQESSWIKRLKKHVKNLSFIRELIWNFRTWDTLELKMWIEDFEPDALFAVLGNCGFVHKIAMDTSQRYNLPLYVYFTDDYVLNDDSTNFVQHLHYKYINRIYKNTLYMATNAFVIGTEMQKAYKEKYGRNFDILINAIDFSYYENIEYLKIDDTKHIIISFIGGIHLNRWKSIVELATMCKLIPGYSFEINVYSLSEPEKHIQNLFDKTGINYKGALTADEVVKTMEKSHILLHVESFDYEQRLYTRFSVSTKIPEYMASKRGIIAFGPAEIASIKIFSDNGIGCVLTDKQTEQEKIVALTEYLDNFNDIDFNRQYDFAFKNFNQDEMILLNKITPPYAK